MIVTLTEQMRHNYVCVHSRGKWHISKPWQRKDSSGRWVVDLSCQLGTQPITTPSAVTQGKRSAWCADCKRWLADRIMRQDWS